MFYPALISQMPVLIWFIADSAESKKFWPAIWAGIPILALIFNIDWLILLSIVGYGVMIWETIMSWIMPSSPVIAYFSLKNLITGRTFQLMKNTDPQNMQITWEKPTRRKIFSIALAAIAFTCTLLYYISITNSGG